MVGYQSITAIVNELTGTVSLLTSTVNLPATYNFSITTKDPITATGQLKIAFPSVLRLSIVNNCSSLIGTHLSTAPTCTYSSADNSIIFTNLNSSTANIPAQTFTIAVSGITNPPSTLTTPSFSVVTFYSGINGAVDAGSVAGITATKATIDYTKVVIFASSTINSDTGVSYFVSFEINNALTVGSSVVLYFPPAVTFALSAVSSQCQVAINGGTAQPTTCSGTLAAQYIFTFNNPFVSAASVGTTVTLGITGIATNPSNTQPFSPFSIYTYYSDTTLVASL